MIEIRNLRKSFGDLVVLDDINLTIEDGEIYGLVGVSGAGKSTLLRCINGLESYTQGSIKVGGVEVNTLDKKEMMQFRKGVAMIFQQFPLLSRKTVYENIAFPMRCCHYEKDKIDSRVRELAKLVGIENKLGERPRNLSGGQKQRVAIARALTMEPKILLSDEATSALDPVTTHQILALLRDINEKLGVTIIVVTHQMAVVKEVCEKVALLKNGKLVITGRVDELFTQQPEELRAFLGEEQYRVDKGGANFEIILSDDDESKTIVSALSREAGVDVSIQDGEMSKYRDKSLGYLVINVPEEDRDVVERFLSTKDVVWRRYASAEREDG